jgi:glucosamine-6-phosphate deaminase
MRECARTCFASETDVCHQALSSAKAPPYASRLCSPRPLLTCWRPQDVGEYIATYIARRITEFAPTPTKKFVLGLPTGSSPIPTYKALIKLVKAGKLSFKNVVTFNMDEYVGLPRDHPESYHTFMCGPSLLLLSVVEPDHRHARRFTQFFSHIDIPPEHVNILNGTVQDLIGECAAYEKRIKDVGGIDLFLAGIGEDGHLAFNEPGESCVEVGCACRGGVGDAEGA